jgi:stage II sporulation protein D
VRREGSSLTPALSLSEGEGEPCSTATSTAVLLAFAVLVAPIAARAEERVRIAVAVGAARVELSAAGLSAQPLRDGAAREPVAGARAEVALAGDALAVDGAAVDAPGVLFAADEPIRFGALLLAGEVEVRRGPVGLDVVNALPMEDYVAAVTGSEMPATFPAAALETQAVAARTFALSRKLEAVAEGRAWHLGATVLHQVYRGTRVDPRARAAAAATAGLVLVKDHAPIEAYFHAACGGRTERGADALGRDHAYLASVPCGRCRAAPRFAWTVRVPADELGRLAGVGAAATAAKVVSRTGSGRAARVEIAARGRRVTLGAVDLRQRLGFERLPSLLFDVGADGGAIVFKGRGAGHGAGLCQWGAAGFAREGRDYRAILAHYYPGTELVRMY